MMNIGGIATGKITFGEAEIVDRIQQVSFAHAVSSADTHHPFRKPIRLEGIVFELNE
jgi:hypothetical protein